MISSFVIVTSTVVLCKTLVFDYINLPMIIVASNLSYDICLCFLLYVFRPQKLPEHFSLVIDLYDTDFDIHHINLYFAKFTKKNFIKNDLVANNMTEVEISEFKTNLEIPCVILNPTREFNGKIFI